SRTTPRPRPAPGWTCTRPRHHARQHRQSPLRGPAKSPAPVPFLTRHLGSPRRGASELWRWYRGAGSTEVAELFRFQPLTDFLHCAGLRAPCRPATWGVRGIPMGQMYGDNGIVLDLDSVAHAIAEADVLVVGFEM